MVTVVVHQVEVISEVVVVVVCLAGHVSRDCQNPTTTCRYCRAVDHVIEQCPQLIAKIQEINSTPTQNLHMIFVEKKPAPAINVVTRSGAMMHIQPAEKQDWVRQAPVKVPTFEIERGKETFMETQKDFGDSTTAVEPAQPHQQQSQPHEASTDNISTLSSFLQSCLKLLRNQNALSELQKVIASYEPQHGSGQAKFVHRVKRTGREMRLNAQIGEYEMTGQKSMS